jgi:hypothetical protein
LARLFVNLYVDARLVFVHLLTAVCSNFALCSIVSRSGTGIQDSICTLGHGIVGRRLDMTDVRIYTAESDRRSTVKSTPCPQKVTENQSQQENAALLE